MTKQNTKSKTKSLRGLENCRVVEIGIGNFAECAHWGSIDCPHALPLAYCLLCMHPRVEDIIENTKKVLAQKAKSLAIMQQ